MGVTFFEILYGYCPYEDKTIPKLISKIELNPIKFPTNSLHFKISPKLIDFILKLLTLNPNKRIGFDQLQNINIPELFEEKKHIPSVHI